MNPENNKQKHMSGVITVMGVLTAILFVSIVILAVGAILMN